MSARGAAAVAALCALALGAGAATPEPPTARDVLRAALQLRDQPLQAHPSCRRAGPDAADRTIGDYLAGMLAAMDTPINTIETQCEARDGGGHQCALWLKHRDDEERWAWGLSFAVDAARRPLRQTVRCIGAG